MLRNPDLDLAKLQEAQSSENHGIPRMLSLGIGESGITLSSLSLRLDPAPQISRLLN